MGIETVLIASAVAGAAVAYQNGQEQKKAAEKASQQAQQAAQANEQQAKKAQAQAREASVKQADQITQAMSKANARTPDVASLLSGNTRAASEGGGGTMLTGPQGVDPNLLNLGKNTLLGS